MKVSAILTLLAGLVLGFFIGQATRSTAPSSPTVAQRPGAAPSRQRPPPDATVYRLPVEDSPARGSADALVTLVEFSDYQCPYCRQGHATVSQVEKKYAGKIRLVMKQFPLVSLHPQAMPAAKAAVAAGLQGRYWEMHDRLFASPQLDPDTLERYAKEIGLDVDRWKRDQADPKVAAIIQRDMDLATNVNVSGTPAFFVNGRRLPVAPPRWTPSAASSTRSWPRPRPWSAGACRPRRCTRRSRRSRSPRRFRRRWSRRSMPRPTRRPSARRWRRSPSWSGATSSARTAPGRPRSSTRSARRTPKDVRFVFRHFPLPMHPDAPLAARAAVAAQAQGKFWQMHDWMFAHQRELDRASLEKAAASLGMDLAKFRAALDNAATESRVQADAQAAQTVGVSATPTFFVNGREHVGGWPTVDAVKAEIDKEIARADKLLSSGVKPADLYGRLVADSAGPSGARN